jgi:regulation of enolase protein 1 (concanavalin A-like superfamily)
MLDEVPRVAAPDPDPPRQEGPARPAMKEVVGRIPGLSERSRIIDPDGDCQVFLDRANDRASIHVPGVAHLLSAEYDRMNAPRILQEARGAFEVRVKVAGISQPGSRVSTTLYAPYHGAGIVIWKDPGHYVRLEIATDFRKGKTHPYANFELRQDGRLASSWGIKIEDGSTYLRIQRMGDELHAAFSPDGSSWTPFAPLTASLPDRVEVGVVAINSAAKPLKAEFERFQLIIGPQAGSGADADRVPPKASAPRDVIGPTPVAKPARAVPGAPGSAGGS